MSGFSSVSIRIDGFISNPVESNPIGRVGTGPDVASVYLSRSFSLGLSVRQVYGISWFFVAIFPRRSPRLFQGIKIELLESVTRNLCRGIVQLSGYSYIRRSCFGKVARYFDRLEDNDLSPKNSSLTRKIPSITGE